jgi:protein-S-isoprenylcysteine O-methyltransferase Ste14
MSVTTSPAKPILQLRGLYEALAFVAPICLFGLLAAIRVDKFIETHNPVAILNAVGLTVLTMTFVFRKPVKEVDRSFKSLGAAWLGNFLPFALILHNHSDWAGPVPTAIEVVTVALAIWTVLSLRSSMGVAPANRGIKTGGPYKFIRHPLYTLVIISQIGLLMEYPSIINGVILTVAIVFKGFMIRNEERVLRNDPAYVEYSQKVRYRVIPGVI